MYDRGRYFSVTGRHLPGTPSLINAREEQLRALHEQIWSADLLVLVKIFMFYISESSEWINIHCPWKSNHSGTDQVRDGGLHKGPDGTINGFNCFHAGCAEKKLGDVRALFGLKGGHASEFITDEKGNIRRDNQENIRRAIKMLGVKLEYDIFEERAYFATNNGRHVLDDDAVRRMWFVIDETYFFRATKDFFSDVIEDTAKMVRTHPIIAYLNGLVWDQTPRIDEWLIAHGKAHDNPLTRSISAKVLMAAVRRIRKPGCKFDEMLVLESGQGKMKSSALLALCPNDAWFSDDLPLNVDAKQVIERTTGKWIIEASDLSGMRKSDVEHLKAMLSRQVDGPVRRAYGRIAEEKARHWIIIGTTNSSAYLKDQTGNRRFWPVKVGEFDLDGIRKNRDQLWAEAAFREAQGESIRLDPKFYEEMSCSQEDRIIRDPWEERILDSDVDLTADYIPVSAIWAILEVVNFHDLRLAERVHVVMQRLGYPIKRRARVNGVTQHCWVRRDKAEHMGWALDGGTRPDWLK